MNFRVRTSASIPLLVFLCALLFSGCKKTEYPNPLLAVLASEDPAIRRVMENLSQHELQIRLTRIHREDEGIQFEDFDYQVDDSVYFYPASTAKFAVAVAALERLNEWEEADLDTSYYVEGDSLEATFGQDIQAVFAVSDNHANNRLFELLGQDQLNQRLRDRGVGPIRISHRLSTTLADTLITKPLLIQGEGDLSTATQALDNQPIEPLSIKGILKGKGYMAGGQRINEAFDFSRKNYFPIGTQNALLKRVIFPEAFPEEEQLKISEEQRTFLLEAMHKLPRRQGYDPQHYYDSYVKFFLFGDDKNPIPEEFKIYNKVGYAYGTLTDTAYIINEEEGVEFILHATLLVNKDQIFNDDQYEYEDVGIPFLAALGREFYRLEKLNNK